MERIWAIGNALDPAARLLPAAGDAYCEAVAIDALLVQEECGACPESEEAVRESV